LIVIENDEEYKTIRSLAKALGISTKTLKSWELEGKIPTAKRSKFRWRIYSDEEFKKIISLVKANNYFRKDS